MEEIFILIFGAVAAAIPAIAALVLMGPLRRRSINEMALENAQVAALITQTNMACAVNSNMMDAQADKTQEA
jgi:hypothetical protein